MKHIPGQWRQKSRVVALGLVVMLGAAAGPLARAGGVDFKQASNRNPLPGNVIWINSILQQNNSRYFEGLSTLQRLVVLDIPAALSDNPNRHTLDFNHEAAKSGFHAYDFLTSWEQARAASIYYSGSDLFDPLNPDGENLTSGSTGDIIRQLRGGPYRFAVPAPNGLGTVENDDVQTRANAYALKFGERVIRLYGDAPILSAELRFNGYSGNTDKFAEYTLVWESSSTNVLIEMAGHLAIGGVSGNPLGYGPGRGSASISGGPYHFKLATLNGAALGSQDNQIKGADILAPPPVVELNVSAQNICAGSGPATFTATVTADGTPPFSYAWTGPNGFTSNAPTISVSVAGTYSVVVTDGNGLTSPAISAVLTVSPCPVVTIAAAQITCSKPQIDLVAESSATNLSFHWTGPGIVSGGEQGIVTVNQRGEYTLVATDPNGCSTTASAVVDENKLQPDVTVEGGTLTCASPQTSLRASSATVGALFQWSGPGIVAGADTATPTVNRVGTYQVMVTSPSNGCSATATTVVNENRTVPVVTAAGGVLTCVRQELRVSSSSSTAGTKFTWSGPGIVSGADTPSPLINKPGEYIVTVQDPANGCSATATAIVSENLTAPVVNVTGATLTCARTEASLRASCATVGATFRWSGPGVVSGAETDSPLVNLAGVYLVTATDPANGCATTASVTVTEDKQPPVVSASGAALTCAEPIAMLRAVSSSPSSTFIWTGPGIVSGNDTATPSVNQPGVYSVLITDQRNGCSATATAIVSENKTAPELTATGGTLTCARTEVSLRASCATVGATFRWSGPGVVGGAETDSPLVNLAGVYLVTVTDPANGCAATASVTVTEDKQPPVVSASGATLTCAEPIATLRAVSSSPSSTFIWTGPGIVSGNDTATISVNAPGTYVVTVTDPATRCSSTSTVAVLEDKTPPIITAEGGTLTCARQVLTLHATASITNASFMWTGPGILAGGDSAGPKVSATGVYTVVVTDPANGCAASTTATVTQDTSTPVVTTQGAVLTCSQTQAVISAAATKPGMTFGWSGPGIVSGADSVNCVVNAGGLYRVAVTDPATGCSTTASVSVTEENNPPVAVITAPDSVQPNSTNNLLRATCPAGSALAWTASGPGWGICGRADTNEATFSAGCAGSSGTFTLAVKSPGGCTSTYQVTVVARAADEAALVSMGQGFYGNSGGKLNGIKTPDLIRRLLTNSQSGGPLPLVVGKLGVRSLTIPLESAQWITGRLPAGGAPSALPNFKDQILKAATGQTSPALPISQGRFANVLLGQTVTLSLNTRLSPGLLAFRLSSPFVTQKALPGPDKTIGTADDIRGVETATFRIPATVLTALGRLALERSVTGLLELANRALAGMDRGGATLSDVNAAVDAINRGFDGGRFPVFAGDQVFVSNLVAEGASFVSAQEIAQFSEGLSGSSHQITDLANEAPILTMARGTNLTFVVMWPAAHSNCVLQTSSSMTSPNWLDVTTPPVVRDNLCVLTNTMDNGMQFFRLKKP